MNDLSKEMGVDPRIIDEMIDKYHELGLLTGIFEDAAGENSPAHRHGAATLFTLAGSAQVCLDGETWQEVAAGSEITIHDDQLHEVIAGPTGWRYLFASSKDEAERQGILDRVS
jgi:quercetin dioxygenase-like cupin family protein